MEENRRRGSAGFRATRTRQSGKMNSSRSPWTDVTSESFAVSISPVLFHEIGPTLVGDRQLLSKSRG